MKIKNLFFSKEFFNSSIVSTTNFVVGVINFGFHIAIQRILGPEKYGVVYPLVILSLFISLIPNTFQFIMTKQLSIFLHQNKKEETYSFIKNSFVLTIFFSMIILGCFFLMLPLLKKFFHISSNKDFYYLIVMTIAPFLSVVFLSFLQARENFIFYSLTQIFSTLFKFISGFIIVWYTKEYIGVIFSFILGNVFLILLLLFEFFNYSLKNNLKVDKKNKSFNIKEFFNSFRKTFPAVSSFIIFSNIDLIIVRYNFPNLSGLYSSVSVIGKASFYVALAVSTVFLPILSKSKEIKKTNRLALFFLSLFLGLFLLTVFLGSEIISKYILKNQFYGFESLLPYYSLMYIPYAYITYLVNYYVISNKKIYYISIFFAIILQVFLILTFAKTLLNVANIVGLTGVFVLLVLIVESYFEKNLIKKTF